MKKCSKCKEEKDLDLFYNSKHTKSGKTSQCKKCMSDYRKSKRKKNRDYQRNRRATNNDLVCEQRRNSWRRLDPRKRILQQSRSRAKRKGIDFNLELEDIIIPNECPLLGLPFIIGTKDNYEQTHSLDRVDPTKGYTKDNVWVVTKKANSMKNSATKEELLYFAYKIIEYFEDDDIVRPCRKLQELEDKEPLG
jgi:hypothetical protein